MYYNSKRAVTMPSNDAIADVSVVNPVVDDSVPVTSDNLDVSSNLDTVDNTNNEAINGTENNLENTESGDVSTDMPSTDTSIDMPEENNSLISTMPIVDGNMGFDDSMMGGDTQDGGKGLSNTAILSIVIGACVVVGIVLGIIFGKRAANK